MLDHVVLEAIKLGETQNDAKNDDQTFAKTTEISDPIENAIHITVYSIEGQIKLKSNLHVYVVWKFVRSTE
jgi:hypothetical protein